MIRFENISKSFGKNLVLDNIQFEIKGSGVKAILGPNGSGKTTLIKSFLNMVLPDEGHIYWKDAAIKNEYFYRNRIAYIPQIAHYPENLTVTELFDLIESFRHQKQDSSELVKDFRLEPFLQKRLGTLSGGTLQKVSIVQAFMMDADLYIMDEPSTGLDPLSLGIFKKYVRQKVEDGKTLILTTHIMSLVEELASEIIYILDGNVFFQGSPGDLKSKRSKPTIEEAIADILLEQEGAFIKNKDSNE